DSTLLARRAAVAHAVYSPEVRHPVEVGADDEQHLLTWLSKRLGAKVRAPKLDEVGMSLVGGRLLPGDSGPVAQFMYQSQNGRRATQDERARAQVLQQHIERGELEARVLRFQHEVLLLFGHQQLGDRSPGRAALHHVLEQRAEIRAPAAEVVVDVDRGNAGRL